MNTATSRHLPCTDPVYQACVAATAHNCGAIVDSPSVDDTGIRVTFSSWPRQREALRALRLLSYAVVPQPACTLLISGWDQQLLRCRAERLEHTVTLLQRWLCTLADETLDTFLAAPEYGTADEYLAQRRAIAQAKAAACGALDHYGPRLSTDVSDADLARVSAELHAVLLRVVAAQHAAAALIRRHIETVRAALGLYLQYRDIRGCTEIQKARAKTLLDIGQGVSAFVDVARYEADQRPYQARRCSQQQEVMRLDVT